MDVIQSQSFIKVVVTKKFDSGQKIILKTEEKGQDCVDYFCERVKELLIP